MGVLNCATLKDLRILVASCDLNKFPDDADVFINCNDGLTVSYSSAERGMEGYTLDMKTGEVEYVD